MYCNLTKGRFGSTDSVARQLRPTTFYIYIQFAEKIPTAATTVTRLSRANPQFAVSAM